MMKRFFPFLAVFLCSAGAVYAAQDIPVLSAADLPGGKIVSTDYYSGKALFGYIDGGAELYLEYRFKKLGRQEVLFAGERYTLECYQMEGAYEAYGIFSVQRFRCVPVDSASLNTCLSKYQLQAVLGHCYISIINETGSNAARKGSIDIFHVMQAKIKPEQINFHPIFRSPEFAPYVRSLIVACGQLGVQNGFSEWDRFFQSTPRFLLSLLPIEQGSERFAIAHLRFPTNDQCVEFCRLAGFTDLPTGSLQRRESAGMIRYVRRLENEELLFAEATPAFPDVGTFVRLMSK